MSGQPAIRTAWTRGILADYEEHRDPTRVAACLARVSPASLQVIQGLDDYDWLPIVHHIELVEAMLADLGPAEYVAVYRRGSLAMMKSRLLAATAVQGVRVFGRRAILRVLPRGWNLVCRDCGKLTVSRHPVRNSTSVQLLDMPGIVARSRGIQLAIASMLAAACDLGGFPGRVQIDRDEVRDRTFAFHVSLYGEPEFREDAPDIELDDMPLE